MKAIVLSCDEYLPLVDHMIASYDIIWPNNPFEFRIPYQDYPYWLKHKYKDRIELFQTDKGFVSTINTLLKDLKDNDWIFWCIDDKYPVEIKIDEVDQIHDWVKNITDEKIAGVMFCRPLNLYLKENLQHKYNYIKDLHGREYIRRKNYKQIWTHQYLRVKVIRDLFNSFPKKNFKAKEMDSFKNNIKLPENHGLYVLKCSFIYFGESTTRGHLTKNCANHFYNLKKKLPKNFYITNKKIYIGHDSFKSSKLNLYLKIFIYKIKQELKNIVKIVSKK